MRRRKVHFACLLAVLCSLLAPAAAAEADKKDDAKTEAPVAAKAPAAELAEAHKLYLGGNYAEAQEKYEAAVPKHRWMPRSGWPAALPPKVSSTKPSKR